MSKQPEHGFEDRSLRGEASRQRRAAGRSAACLLGLTLAAASASACGSPSPEPNAKPDRTPAPRAEEPAPPPIAAPKGSPSRPPSPVVELELGWGFAAARLENGELWYWGHWLDGPNQAQPVPKRIPMSGDIVAMSAALSHAYLCLVDSEGKARCLARPTVGGTDWMDSWAKMDAIDPPFVERLTGVSQVGVSEYRGCALHEDGTVSCWSPFDEKGLLPSSLPLEQRPAKVEGLDAVAQLVVGAGHACALRKDRSVWCWGRGEWGQLGEPDYAGPEGEMVQTGRHIDIVGMRVRPQPTQVAGLPEVDELAAGSSHTCAREGGRVWCWGFNADGQLGDGSLDERARPAPVPGIEDATLLVAGDSTTCVRTGEGRVQCWGHDLMDNAFGNHSAKGVAVVAGLSQVELLGVGDTGACAVQESGPVVCWGSNRYGQNGDGTTTPSAPNYVRWP